MFDLKHDSYRGEDCLNKNLITFGVYAILATIGFIILYTVEDGNTGSGFGFVLAACSAFACTVAISSIIDIAICNIVKPKDP